MLKLTKRLTAGNPNTSLTLPLDKRIHSRLRVTLDNGVEAGVLLERGQILRHGDLIGSEEGNVIEVQAAPESVSVVRCDNTLLLSRLCYHLGNRHVPLQIRAGVISYQHDHVLDDMVRGLGVEPEHTMAPFEPEAGAYDTHTHKSHSHTAATDNADHAHHKSTKHGHSHDHLHSHTHPNADAK